MRDTVTGGVDRHIFSVEYETPSHITCWKLSHSQHPRLRYGTSWPDVRFGGISFTGLTGRGGDDVGDPSVNTCIRLVQKFEGLRFSYAYYGIWPFAASVYKIC